MDFLLAEKEATLTKNNLKRRPGGRTQLPLHVFVTEGKVTEIDYFEFIRDLLHIPKERVQFIPSNCTNPIGIVNDVKNRMRKNEKEAKHGRESKVDNWWAIFDTEGNINNVKSAITMAQDNNIKLILSDPCIEYWLFLHFRYSTRVYDSSERMERALKEFIPNWNKHIEMESIIYSLPFAMKNARRLRENHTQKGIYQPATDCDLVIDALIEQGNPKCFINDIDRHAFDEEKLFMKNFIGVKPY